MGAKDSDQPQKQLGLFDAASIIVGIVIGATIYEMPPGIFRDVPDALTAYGVWAACGVLALIGALCYAELATTYPRSGGDYVYLTRAYGPFIGYLFGWAQLAVIQTASIGLMAYIFADYATRLLLLQAGESLTDYRPQVEMYGPVGFAALSVVVMTLLNVLGVTLGKLAQNVLTLVKVLGLVGIVVVGFAYPRHDYNSFEGEVVRTGAASITLKTAQGEEKTFAVTAPRKATDADKGSSGTPLRIGFESSITPKDEKTRPVALSDFTAGMPTKVVVREDAPGQALRIEGEYARLNPLALMSVLVLVFLAYGGYNDAAFVAAEVRNPSRNIPRALILGTFGVMVIYVLINVAYVNGLGFEGARASGQIAADVLKRLPWSYGEQAMCVLVMISALGAVNGLIFTSSRIYATLGTDYSLFSPLARREGQTSPPVSSLLLQMIIALLMILSVGTTFGQDVLNRGLHYLGQQPVSWAGQGGFYSLLRCTAPIFWLFFLMTGLALFQLRIRDRDVPRPFPVPLFPLLPLIFVATCGYLLYSGIRYAGGLGFVGFVLVLAGLPFYVFSRRTAPDEVPSQTTNGR